MTTDQYLRAVEKKPKKALWVCQHNPGKTFNQLVTLVNDLGLGGVIEVTTPDIMELKNENRRLLDMVYEKDKELAKKDEMLRVCKEALDAISGMPDAHPLSPAGKLSFEADIANQALSRGDELCKGE